jgi:hypothetical protein
LRGGGQSPCPLKTSVQQLKCAFGASILDGAKIEIRRLYRLPPRLKPPRIFLLTKPRAGIYTVIAVRANAREEMFFMFFGFSFFGKRSRTERGEWYGRSKEKDF